MECNSCQLATALTPNWLAGVYFAFIAPDNGRNYSWAIPAVVAALLLVSVALLLVTAVLDPGFVPRNTNPNDAELGCAESSALMHSCLLRLTGLNALQRVLDA